jgi:hypothetical protein
MNNDEDYWFCYCCNNLIDGNYVIDEDGNRIKEHTCIRNCSECPDMPFCGGSEY